MRFGGIHLLHFITFNKKTFLTIAYGYCSCSCFSSCSCFCSCFCSMRGILYLQDIGIVGRQVEAMEAIAAFISCQTVLGSYPYPSLPIAVEYIDVVIGQGGAVFRIVEELDIVAAIIHVDSSRCAYPYQLLGILCDGSYIERREHEVLARMLSLAFEHLLRAPLVGVDGVDGCQNAEDGKGSNQGISSDLVHI